LPIAADADKLLAMNGLKRLRLERLMTQVELSAKTGVSPRTLAIAENGGFVGMKTRRRILDSLGEPYERHMELFGPIVREDREGELSD